VKTCEVYKEKGFDYLKKITAVDYIDHLEIVYLIYNISTKKDEIIKTKIGVENPSVDTVIDIYRAADWYEREMSEMFGITIKGRKTNRLLLELWNGTEPPLRKSFIWGKDYKR
jgi:NADH-quinone oxidoreductase subunit C